MSNWRSMYAARDWDGIENWWQSCEDSEELEAIFQLLKRDLPPQILINGMEMRQAYPHPKDVAPEWEGAALILYLGELEATINGDPETDPDVWATLESEVSTLMHGLIAAQSEPTKGDPSMSRTVHAHSALEFLDQLDREAKIMIAQADPDPEEREWLRHVIGQAALAAFRAGVHAQVASSKTIEGHAVRGKKVLSAAEASGTARRGKTKDLTAAIIKSMEGYILEGHTVSRAATLTAEKNIGTSPAANRKAYTRHKG